MAWRARAARRPTWRPVKGRRTVGIRHPRGHLEERRIPRAHHSRAFLAGVPLSEARRAELSVRGARVSVTARSEALATGGGRLVGTERTTGSELRSVGLTTGSESRGTVSRRLRHGDRDRSSSRRARAAGASAARRARARIISKASRAARSSGSSAARRRARAAAAAARAVATRVPVMKQCELLPS